jgi:hypothetical protein
MECEREGWEGWKGQREMCVVSSFDLTGGEWRMDVCIRFCLCAGTHSRA